MVDGASWKSGVSVTHGTSHDSFGRRSPKFSLGLARVGTLEDQPICALLSHLRQALSNEGTGLLAAQHRDRQKTRDAAIHKARIIGSARIMLVHINVSTQTSHQLKLTSSH